MSFVIEGRKRARTTDIVRNFMWQMWIPELPRILKSYKKAEMDDLVFACKTASIPGITLEIIETNFFGMKQLFPSKVTQGNAFDLPFTEGEDFLIVKTMYEWIMKMHSNNPTDFTYGSSSYLVKRNYAKDVWVRVFGYDKKELPYSFHFVNAFPSNIVEVPMDFADNSAVKYNVTFTYDYWYLDDN